MFKKFFIAVMLVSVHLYSGKKVHVGKRVHLSESVLAELQQKKEANAVQQLSNFVFAENRLCLFYSCEQLRQLQLKRFKKDKLMIHYTMPTEDSLQVTVSVGRKSPSKKNEVIVNEQYARDYQARKICMGIAMRLVRQAERSMKLRHMMNDIDFSNGQGVCLPISLK